LKVVSIDNSNECHVTCRQCRYWDAKPTKSEDEVMSLKEFLNDIKERSKEATIFFITIPKQKQGGHFKILGGYHKPLEMGYNIHQITKEPFEM